MVRILVFGFCITGGRCFWTGLGAPLTSRLPEGFASGWACSHRGNLGRRYSCGVWIQRLAARKSVKLLATTGAGDDEPSRPSPQDLKRQAEELRREVVEMEEVAAKTRRLREDMTIRDEVPIYPRTLLNSSWKIITEIRGRKSEKNRIPVQLTFKCRFLEGKNVVEVEQGHSFIKRGYVWVPDRDTNDGLEYMAFDVKVEGLSAIPDGKMYLNARIDTIKGKDGETCYCLNDGVVTIKEVIKTGYWGIFNAAGILAEFKVVGTFVATPLSGMSWNEEAEEGTEASPA